MPDEGHVDGEKVERMEKGSLFMKLKIKFLHILIIDLSKQR